MRPRKLLSCIVNLAVAKREMRVETSQQRQTALLYASEKKKVHFPETLTPFPHMAEAGGWRGKPSAHPAI